MALNIAELTAKIGALEAELEVEMAKKAASIGVGLEHGKAKFEAELLRRHKDMKTKLWAYVRAAHPLVILTAPVLYAGIIPFVLLDIFVTLYQAICFPIYGIEKVRRSDYLIFDRRYLAYLNIVEKVNCAYCSYANGLIGYAREIAGRTERLWCPIKHARKVIGAHGHYQEFAEFGDVDTFCAEPAKKTT